MKFNRKVAKALVAAIASILLVLGVANSDKIVGVLEAAAEFVPEETPAVVPTDAGVSSPSAADAGL